MKVRPHLAQWLKQAEDMGMTPMQAFAAREAKFADELDDRAEAKTTRDWAVDQWRSRMLDENGQPIKAWASHEQRAAAFRTPEYKTSESYRRAVMEIDSVSEDHVGDPVIITPGRNPLSPEVATVESMVASARQDAAQAWLRKNRTDTPEGRLARLEMLTSEDPATREFVDSVTQEITGPTPMKSAMESIQRTGEVARIEMQGNPTGPDRPNPLAINDTDAEGLTSATSYTPPGWGEVQNLK